MALRSWFLAAALLVMARQPAEAQVRQQFGVMTPMRDGVRLASDIWMPEAPGRYPVILIRTPYLKTMEFARFPDIGAYYAARGYVLVVQDVRGRGDSDGEFNFFFQEGQDGYDSIEWLAKQPFSNGRVGMMGLSYLGTVQWLAAKEHPPSLVCMAPTAPAGRYLDELPYSVKVQYQKRRDNHQREDPENESGLCPPAMFIQRRFRFTAQREPREDDRQYRLLQSKKAGEARNAHNERCRRERVFLSKHERLLLCGCVIHDDSPI